MNVLQFRLNKGNINELQLPPKKRKLLSISILKYFIVPSILLVMLYSLVLFLLQGYSVAWTGFGDFTNPNSAYVRGKTLWDWMQLIIIPVFLGISISLLSRSERKNEREVMVDSQRELALQSYLDRMADLLAKEKLRITKNREMFTIARTRTLTVLRGLDGTRKGLVLRFLHEAGLIGEGIAIVKLNGADLRSVNLESASLRNAHLVSVDLAHANLSYANLSYANLSYANLDNGNLGNADLHGADLTEANLRDANLRDVLYDKSTKWPERFDPKKAGAVLLK